jgi:hypothetical protein
MKLLSLLFATLTIFCISGAMMIPAFARQDTTQAPAEKQKGDGASVEASAVEQRTFVPSNFNLMIDGEDKGLVNRIEEAQPAPSIAGAPGVQVDPIAPVTGPPQVRVRQEAGSTFEGVVTTPGPGYTMFSTNGAPARATTNVQLREAAKAGEKQATPDDEDDEEDDSPPP